MENKKSYEHPKAGIFYMVPDPKKLGTYTIYSEIQEEGGADVAHIFLFNQVRKILESRFKVDLEDAYDSYMGIPRGRIIEPGDRQGNWIVTHGADFPLDKYRDAIISEFSLRDAFDLGKLKFEVDTHEKMNPADKRQLELSLKIEFTISGWKSRKK